MNETQFIAFCFALVGSFFWIWSNRANERPARTLGVVVIVGAWLAFRLI